MKKWQDENFLYFQSTVSSKSSDVSTNNSYRSQLIFSILPNIHFPGIAYTSLSPDSCLPLPPKPTSIRIVHSLLIPRYINATKFWVLSAFVAMELQVARDENPAMTFDEVSMERSKSFVKALQVSVLWIFCYIHMRGFQIWWSGFLSFDLFPRLIDFYRMDLDCFLALHVFGLIICFMNLPMNAFLFFFILCFLLRLLMRKCYFLAFACWFLS